MKSKRTKALSIPLRVKKAVAIRDSYDGVPTCIFCGRRGDPVAHYIPRSHGGLGIEENIVTACWKCHLLMDSTTERKRLLAEAKEYLNIFYPDFPDEKRIYRR